MAKLYDRVLRRAERVDLHLEGGGGKGNIELDLLCYLRENYGLELAIRDTAFRSRVRLIAAV